MRPLTILSEHVNPEFATRTAALFEDLATGLADATSWEGDPAASFRPKGGSGPTGAGTTKGWRTGAIEATMWSDGVGYRIAFRIGSGVSTVQTSIEMPRTLTFLRSDVATARLLRTMASRLRSSVPVGHPREVAATSAEDGLVAALSAAIADETSDGPIPSPHVVRLPSPLGSRIDPGSIAVRDGNVLLPSRAFERLLRRRLPSTLMVACGDAESDSLLSIVGATRFVDVRRLDAIERLRLGVAAEGHVPHDHPPLVEWRSLQKEKR